MRFPLLAAAVVLAAAVAAPALPTAQPAGDTASIAREVNLAAAAATSVIGSLQSKINAGTATPADIAPEALEAQFQRAVTSASGAAPAPAPELGAIRAKVGKAMHEVIEQFRPDILRGGQDAFVPAFFRAQLFERFNAAEPGIRAVVSMRSSELINRDSAIDRLINDPEIVAHVTKLLEGGHREPELRTFGARTVGYWPMVIGEACAACHQRNGLNQQVGSFGGATVVIVGR